MAIRPADEYTGKVAAPTAEYPDGKAQNITSPGDGTGTPWEAKLVNDIFGFQQFLTATAGITPSGTPDNATTSQYFQAIWKLLNVRTLAYNIVSDVDLTLTAPQNLYAKIVVTDTGVVLTAGRNIILDTVGRILVFTNSTARTLTVKTLAGTGVAVLAGSTATLLNDGVNVGVLPLTVETPPQFDKDTSVATTEFVQRALGNSRTLIQITANTTLTSADSGTSYIVAGAGGITITLPSVATCPLGSKFEFINASSSNITVSRAGTDAIVGNNGASVTSIILGGGDTLVLDSQLSQWVVISGSAQLKFSSVFGSLQSANGYQKLPSGLIMQWGTDVGSTGGAKAVVFPIAFPTVARSVVMTSAATGVPSSTVLENIPSTTGFSFSNWTIGTTPTRTNNTAFWYAIGY